MQNSVAQNTAFLTIASVLQKVISFVYFTLVARSIGAEGTGKYFFALSFTTIFVVFVDLGLTNVLVRESARVKERMQEYFSSILFVKLILGVLTYVAAFVVVRALGYPVETRHLVYVGGITMILDSIHLSIYGVMRAAGNLRYEALGMVLSQLATLILGSVFLFLHLPLVYLMIAFVIPSGLNVVYAGSMLYRTYSVVMRPRYNREVTRFLVVLTIPFALAAIFNRVYGYIDSILLSKLATDEVLGWYSIPYKVVSAFQFIPAALIAALYPRFSEYFVYDKERLKIIFQQGLVYLLFIALPVAAGISLLAKDIILAVFTSEYLPSIVPLQILMTGLVFSFVNFECGALLNACNRQKLQTALVAFIMVFNIVLNIILIPRYGAIGAAVSAGVSNMILTIVSIVIASQVIGLHIWALIKRVTQLLVSTIVMGFAVWYTNMHIHFIGAIVVGVIIYGFMLYMTKVVRVEQFREMKEMLSR